MLLKYDCVNLYKKLAIVESVIVES